MKKGYLAIVLDKPSRRALLKMAVHPKKYADHLTLAYKPDAATLRKYIAMVGTTVKLVVVGIACDDHGQAVYIPAIKAENEYPHITVSCTWSTAPVYSNTLLAEASAAGTIEPLEMLLSGEVQLVGGSEVWRRRVLSKSRSGKQSSATSQEEKERTDE